MIFNPEEFKKYLAIDKNALDQDIIHQSMLFYQVGEALTEANAQRDFLKERLASTDAIIEAEVRKKLNKANIRDTKDLVAQHVQLDERHTEAMDKYLSAKKHADLMTVLKESFQMRSYMLKDLVQLHTINYFEDGTKRGTNKADTFVYEERRKAMAEARARK